MYLPILLSLWYIITILFLCFCAKWQISHLIRVYLPLSFFKYNYLLLTNIQDLDFYPAHAVFDDQMTFHDMDPVILSSA